VDKTSYEKPEGWLAFNHSPARGLSIGSEPVNRLDVALAKDGQSILLR